MTCDERCLTPLQWQLQRNKSTSSSPVVVNRNVSTSHVPNHPHPPTSTQTSGILSPGSHSPHIPAHLLSGSGAMVSPLAHGYGFSGGGAHHSMSPQSLGISSPTEEDAHKLRLTVAEMRRDAGASSWFIFFNGNLVVFAALLEQRVRAAEVLSSK